MGINLIFQIATKERWPFWDIAELKERCLILYMVMRLIACFGILTASLQADSTLVSGLVARYTFNGNGSDSSGNNYAAALNGDYAFLPGGGIHITGRNSDYYSGGGYVSIPISSMGISQSFTISIQMSNVQQLHLDGEMFAFWGQETSGNNIVAIGSGYSNPNDVFFTHYLRGGGGTGYNTAVPNSINELHTYTVTQGPTNFSAYLDGQLVGAGSNSIGLPSQSNLFLGRHDWYSYSSRLSANYYDVQIYNRELSASEVQLVPEPSALSLLAVGLGVLFRRSRKRD